MMNLFLVIFGVLFLIVFIWVSWINWDSAFKMFKKKEHQSWVPLLGGVSGAIAFVILPWEMLSELWWVPFVLDWGSVPGFLFAFIRLAYLFCKYVGRMLRVGPFR